MASTCVNKCPVEHKLTLTLPECAEYSNISQNKLSALLRLPNCPFVLYVGNKKLIKRREFEQFISGMTEI